MTQQIDVIGLGAGDLNQIPLGVYKRIKAADRIYVRTDDHPAVEELQVEGVAITSFDAVYEAHHQFEDVYQEIVHRLLIEAENGPVVYAVPGHPSVAEKTVKLLIEKGQEKHLAINIIGGQSFLDDMFKALAIDPIEGMTFMDARDIGAGAFVLDKHMIICQVYDAFTASEVKLELLEQLPPDYPITIVRNAGLSNEAVIRLPLYELDHDFPTNNLTSVYVPPVTEDKLLYHTFDKLRQVIRDLRAPNGCPWDRKQTHESLKPYLLEEAYEVLGAIDEQDENHLSEELGDVLLQVMLHAQIGEDDGFFTIDDVIRVLTEKMIRRHPHVFGNGKAANAEDVKQNWDAIKRQEKGKSERRSILDGIEAALPPLMRAFDLQKKAAKVGFDWPDLTSTWDKVKEEMDELESAEGEDIARELGDVLFSLVNVSRKLNIHPTVALEATIKKFTDRFSYIERKAAEKKIGLKELSLEKMDEYWDEAKENFKEKKDYDV